MDQNNHEKELEVNKKNREDYEKLMKESSTNLDEFWDSKNILVKLILLFLLSVIVVGSVMIFVTYYKTK